MNKKSIFGNAQIGDRVWSIVYGWGMITEVNHESNYPIIATFYNSNEELTQLSFTKEGKYTMSDIYPSLFWNEFEIPEFVYKKPIPNLKVNTPLIVWSDDSAKTYVRHFAEWYNGKVTTWPDGLTSYSTMIGESIEVWDHWKLCENNTND